MIDSENNRIQGEGDWCEPFHKMIVRGQCPYCGISLANSVPVIKTLLEQLAEQTEEQLQPAQYHGITEYLLNVSDEDR